MSIRGFFRFAVNKLYYFGASVVIFGLVCQNLGLSFSKKITIIGLIFEALIFFFGMFSLEEDDNTKNKNDESDKNKKFYYTDGNGNYYLKNPNSGVVFSSPGVFPAGIGYNGKQLASNAGYVNGDADWYRMPDINSDIDKLKERLEFLQSIKKQQIINLTKGDSSIINNDDIKNEDNSSKILDKTNNDNNVKVKRHYNKRRNTANFKSSSEK